MLIYGIIGGAILGILIIILGEIISRGDGDY
jgi:hypothetical protein